MKKKFVVIIAFIGFVFSGCNEWLDVNPGTEVKKDELLETQKGYRDVLTGAYVRMKDANIYGNALTWGTVEMMAKHWEPTDATTMFYVQNYKYDVAAVQEVFVNIFKTLYKVIADVNGILEDIDKKKDIFTEGNYELIKGEALALRAYCHFDALRLFGPMPTGEISEDKILPYVQTVTKEVHDYSTYKQFVQLLLDDLDEAEELLKKVDPILKYSVADLNNDATVEESLEDDFWGHRQIRMNYYGVLAQKARLYFWIQDPVNAGSYANKVIEAVDGDGKKMYILGNAPGLETGDLAFVEENIVGLYIDKLATKANDTFNATQGSLYTLSWKFTYYVFNAIESVADIRFNKQWVKATRGNNEIHVCKKFLQPETNPRCQVPLIRLSEMYFIAMETAASATLANNLFEEYASTRGIAKVDLTADRVVKLRKEFNKEFYGEGQMFFFYKRTGATSTIEFSQMKPEYYVVPLPEREILFNK